MSDQDLWPEGDEAQAKLPRLPEDPEEFTRELLKGLEGPGWSPTREEWDEWVKEQLARAAQRRRT